MRTIQLGNGLDYERQAIALDGDVRASRLIEKTRQPIERHFDDLFRLTDVMRRGQRSSKDGRCLGQIVGSSIQWLSYDEVLQLGRQLADACYHVSVRPKQPVGVYSANCSAYTLIEYGLYEHSMLLVPIYDTLGSQVASFIANETELTVMFCDTHEKIDKILEQSKEFKTLKHLVIIKSDSAAFAEQKSRVQKCGFQRKFLLFTFVPVTIVYLSTCRLLPHFLGLSFLPFLT